MIHLFTYGSLMCSDIMDRVSGVHAQSTEAVLPEYYRSKIRGEEYPGIVPRPGESVTGRLYFNLSEEAVRRLDIFEGELYDRREVEVVSKTAGAWPAMTYVVKPSYRDRLSDEAWSYCRFLSAGKAKFEKAYMGFAKI